MQIRARGSRCLSKLDRCVWLLQNDRGEEQRITAEAFGAGRKGQNCPQTPRISIITYEQSGSYLSQVALSGSAVDLLADGLEVGWIGCGGRLRLLWGSPGGCMKSRVYGVSQL